MMKAPSPGAVGAVAPTAPTTFLCLFSTEGLLGITTIVAGMAVRYGAPGMVAVSVHAPLAPETWNVGVMLLGGQIALAGIVRISRRAR